jgi:hypothetical protein
MPTGLTTGRLETRGQALHRIDAQLRRLTRKLADQHQADRRVTRKAIDVWLDDRIRVMHHRQP